MTPTQPKAPSPADTQRAEALQGDMTNAELTDAWCKKLPGVTPKPYELTAFALGIEVGFAHARSRERADWDRVHHVLAKHGKHPGRTDDHLADVIDRALASPSIAPDGIAEIERLRAELAEVQADRSVWIRRADKTWHEAHAVAAERERCIATLLALRDASGVNDDGRTWLRRLTRGDCVDALLALGPNA